MNRLKSCLVALGILCVAPSVVATTYHYECDDGTKVALAFPNNDEAVMYYQGELSVLTVAVSASGARYVGDGWQWWGKGIEEGNLAVIVAGEEFASDTGKMCKMITAAAK